MSGWIKLHRKFLNWEWYDDHATMRLFLHLLMAANYKPSRWRGQDIAVGQLLTGRKKLAEDTGLSEKSVRTSLAKLKSTGEVAIKSANKFSIITICNYSKYQDEESDTGQQTGQHLGTQRASKGPAKGHIQEDQEIKKIKNKIIPPADAGEIPPPAVEVEKIRETKTHDRLKAPKRLVAESEHVMLSEPQIESIKSLYADSGLNQHDLKAGIDLLDAYAVNNPKKFSKYVSHFLVLNGWIKTEVMRLKKTELDLERSEKYLENARRPL